MIKIPKTTTATSEIRFMTISCWVADRTNLMVRNIQIANTKSSIATARTLKSLYFIIPLAIISGKHAKSIKRYGGTGILNDSKKELPPPIIPT
ncbi:MAG: hypothetical protein KGJ33_01665, partial [Patescibacteria group bacterium]|nr:hypothetical protein [Patescibacteria group bacterium]